MVGGVYVVFGPDNRVYVGESADILARAVVQFARRLGLSWTIVRYMPGATRTARHVAERQLHIAYRKAGLALCSIDHDEVLARAHAKIDVAARAEGLKRYWREPERRAVQADRMRAVNARRSHESRSQSSSLGWETRRARPVLPPGSSKRTAQRRRAAASRRVRQ
jgi:hypothetical protein